MNVIEFDEKCRDCKGTGVFVGCAERNGAGVVCYVCKGTGCVHRHIEYTPFTKRSNRTDVRRVYERNPGISIGENETLRLEDFGGMPYADWAEGKPFPRGSEMRAYTCPYWWTHQDFRAMRCYYFAGCYSDCKHFADKAACWAEYDAR